MKKITEDQNETRLQAYLARCGLGSRRQCEQFILNGRVRVNGNHITTLGSSVAEGDEVTFDGRPVFPEKKQVYIALNKPKGYLCSMSDPDSRPLASDLLRDATPYRLFHVGRLDFQSSGLILYTNDGSFAETVQHPSSRIEKEYLVETKRLIPEFVKDELLRGVMIEGVRYKAERVYLESQHRVRIVLVEGKNREIRRIFSYYRIAVTKLQRMRIGRLQLGNLKPGRFRFLTEREVKNLLKECGDGNRD